MSNIFKDSFTKRFGAFVMDHWKPLLVVVVLLALAGVAGNHWYKHPHSRWFRPCYWVNQVCTSSQQQKAVVAKAPQLAPAVPIAKAAPVPAVSPQPTASNVSTDCVAVHLTVPPGKDRTVRYVMARGKPINSFDCRGVIERERQTPWSGYCGPGCRHPWHKDILEYMNVHFPEGKPFAYFESSFYRLHADRDAQGAYLATKVTVVFPRAATKGGIAVCVKADKKTPPTYLIRPDSWDKLETKSGSGYRQEYTIPQEFFRETWNPPSK